MNNFSSAACIAAKKDSGTSRPCSVWPTDSSPTAHHKLTANREQDNSAYGNIDRSRSTTISYVACRLFEEDAHAFRGDVSILDTVPALEEFLQHIRIMLIVLMHNLADQYINLRCSCYCLLNLTLARTYASFFSCYNTKLQKTCHPVTSKDKLVE